MDPRLSYAHGAPASLVLEDTLGVPMQEMLPAQIRVVYGRITGFADDDASQSYVPGMSAGLVTDDMGQVLLVASPLIRSRGSPLGRVVPNAVEFAHALLT